MTVNTVVSYRSVAEAFSRIGHMPIQPPEPEGPKRRGPRMPDEATLRVEISDALEALEKEQKDPGVMSSPQHALASAMQSYLLENPPGDPVYIKPRGPLDVQEVKYDERDILGWVGSFFTWWKRIRPEPWLEAPNEPEKIGNGRRLRVALLADWGTGLYGAPISAKSIEKDSDGYDLMMHLGDVYYSGTEKEVRERFLDVWPSRPDAVSRALNSNHEMYTGGEGYFRVTLKEFGQKSSYCALENDSWLLVGLDSAYKDHDLAGSQVQWLEKLLKKAGDRRVILFSHHQPFSLFDGQGPKLVSKLGKLLTEQRIFAWYWGHEHRCILYHPHPVWAMHGRCLGHGGFPHFRDDLAHLPVNEGGKQWRSIGGKNLVPGGIILDSENPFIPGHEDKYGAHGYLTLEFDDAHLNEIVHDPDGSRIWERQLI